MKIRELLLLISLSLGAAGCGQDDLPPNVVLILLDTTRVDHMSLYGYGPSTTPELERLGRSGVVFEQAVSHVPQTLPSTASLMTGRRPAEHGVRVNGLFKLPDEAETLAEALGRAGYQTAGFVSALPLDPRFGIAQGFEEYDADFSQSVLTKQRQRSVAFRGEHHDDFEQRADEVTDKALSWVKERRDPERPFFLFVHYFDAHYPYAPPDDFRGDLQPYDGEIALVDHEIGRLLDEIDRQTGDQTRLVIVAGDHGELLDPKRPTARHAGYLDEAVVRVPLLLHSEELLPDPMRLQGQVALTDVAPTVLELLNLGGLSATGQSLLPMIRGRQPSDRWVFLETLYWQLEDQREDLQRFGVRGSQIKLQRDELRRGDEVTVKESVFDLRRDPAGTTPLPPASSGVPEERLAKLREMIEQYRALGSIAEPMNMDPELEAKLKSLGYLGGEEKK